MTPKNIEKIWVGLKLLTRGRFKGGQSPLAGVYYFLLLSAALSMSRPSWNKPILKSTT